MKKLLNLIVIMMLVAGTATTVHAQERVKKTIKLENQKDGKKPAIKSDIPTKDVEAKESRPANKGGVSQRGSGPYNCYVTVSNYTGYYVKVYLDGYYYGTVGPYDDIYCTTGNGYTSLYAVTTGGSQWWSGSGDCESDYTFTLN
jgi:hypothetical protein